MAKTNINGASDRHAGPGEVGYYEPKQHRQGDPRWDSKRSSTSSVKPTKRSATKKTAGRSTAPNAGRRSKKAATARNAVRSTDGATNSRNSA